MQCRYEGRGRVDRWYGGCVEFAAKVDGWFLAIFFGSGVGMLLMGAVMRSKGRLGRGILGVLGVLFVGIGFYVQSERYVLAASGELWAHNWLGAAFLGHVDQIRAITPSNDSRASRAASLDRLRIDWRNGNVVFIAVEDEDGFLDAVAEASPELERTGDSVTIAR